MVVDLGSDLTANMRALHDDLAACSVSHDVADRVAYSRDLWPRHQITTRSGVPAIAPPGLIVWPNTTEEVANMVRCAAKRGVHVVPYGAGSGVCGGVLPNPNTVVIDMKRMRTLVSIDEDHMTCVAQAGILGQHLEDALAAKGFTLGHFPSSIYCSTLGGWVAARSAGQCSGRYGKIEDMILGLTVVDGAGRVLKADHRGPNPALLPLVTGSEGILGVVTEVKLRIAPAPQERIFSSWLFRSTEDGLDAIRRIYQAGLRPAVARLYDPFDSMIARRGGLRTERAQKTSAKSKETKTKAKTHAQPGLGLRLLIKALRKPQALNALVEHMPYEVTGGAKMILVFESAPLLAQEELAVARKICFDYRAEDTGEEPARHWLKHRHSVSYRQSPMFAAGAFLDTMEVSATWSRLLPVYHAVRNALAKHVFVMAHFSHAYPDGASIYFTFVSAAKSDAEALAVYDDTWKEALRAVIDAGGSLSHHHGVGRSKAPAMRREQGAAVDVVQALKRVMDPHCLLNPGALIPIDSPTNARHVRDAQKAAIKNTATLAAFLHEVRRKYPDMIAPQNTNTSSSSSTVLKPQNTAQLAAVVILANQHRQALTAPGAVHRKDACVIELEHMHQSINFDGASRIIHVEAGIQVRTLEQWLEKRALTLQIDTRNSNSNSDKSVLDKTVGAWLAEGAVGARSHDNDPVDQLVAGVEAVLPDGQVLRIRPAPRRAVGPDLVAAMIGARGRLGIFVGVHFVVQPLRPTKEHVFLFPNKLSAKKTLAQLRGHGVRPTRAHAFDAAEGSALRIFLPNNGPLKEATVALVHEKATQHQGVVVSHEDTPNPPSAPPTPCSSVVEALAGELDVFGVFASRT